MHYEIAFALSMASFAAELVHRALGRAGPLLAMNLRLRNVSGVLAVAAWISLAIL